MKTFLSIIITVLLTMPLFAQRTDIKLSTQADSSSNFRVLSSDNTIRMQLNSDGGLYLGGVFGAGVFPSLIKGARLIWHPRKAAFRAGYSINTEWDDANIGNYSIAMGQNVTASGLNSISIGYASAAIGEYSAIIGSYGTANGNYATAIGYSATANGNYSTAVGNAATASGTGAIALGGSSTASTNAAKAFGNNVTASGTFSTAMGNFVTTNGQNGAFIIGDFSKSTDDSSTAANQMTMRFAGGYRLFSNSACSTGVYMNGGSSGWTNYCDRNKKENFCKIDGEQILSKIKDMPITKWNYKGTDKSVKYIGPVAQDFYSAFHLGGVDSLGINSICIDGVNIAAIQALEKRTAELQKANEKITQLEKLVYEQNLELQSQRTSFNELKNDIAKMKSDIQSLTELKSGQEKDNITLNK